MADVVSASALLGASGAGGVPVPDHLTYDLGLLAAFDPSPLDPAALAEDREAELRRVATEDTALLLRRLRGLPVVDTPDGTVSALPTRTTRLPRTKPVPKPKPLTRWQKFALERGIEKTKRSRLVWDEAAGDWKPRHGVGRANDDTKDWLIELKPSDDPTVDAFEQRDLAKKERVLRNKLNEAGNKERASKSAGVAGGKTDYSFDDEGGRGGGGGGGGGGAVVSGGAAAKKLRLSRPPSDPSAKATPTGALVAPRVVEVDADAGGAAAAARPGGKRRRVEGESRTPCVLGMGWEGGGGSVSGTTIPMPRCLRRHQRGAPRQRRQRVRRPRGRAGGAHRGR
jgi:hypothetical protein